MWKSWFVIVSYRCWEQVKLKIIIKNAHEKYIAILRCNGIEWDSNQIRCIIIWMANMYSCVPIVFSTALSLSSSSRNLCPRFDGCRFVKHRFHIHYIPDSIIVCMIENRFIWCDFVNSENSLSIYFPFDNYSIHTHNSRIVTQYTFQKLHQTYIYLHFIIYSFADFQCIAASKCWQNFNGKTMLCVCTHCRQLLPLIYFAMTFSSFFSLFFFVAFRYDTNTLTNAYR